MPSESSIVCAPSSCPRLDRAAHPVEAGAEQPRLLGRPQGQVPAGDAVGEPEVVADQRAGPRLPAHRLLFEHQRRQALGGGVDGGGQAGRAGAHDGDVEEAVGSRRRRGHAIGHLGVVRLDEHLTVEQHEDREPPGIEVQLAEQGGTLGRVGGVERVRHAVAFQPVTDGLRPRRPALPDHPHRDRTDRFGAAPVVERLGHDPVEGLVRLAVRLDHDEIGQAPGDGRRCGRELLGVRGGQEQRPTGLRLRARGRGRAPRPPPVRWPPAGARGVCRRHPAPPAPGDSRR